MLKLNPVLDFVFPQNCALCLKSGFVLCDDCLQSLPPARLSCLRCGRKNPYGLYCPGCRVRFLPDRVLACFKFEGAARELIHSLKYEDITSLVHPLAWQMASMVREMEGYDKFVLVPVPLARKRQAFRGYNQAELICRQLSKELGLEWAGILDRAKSSASQVQAGSRVERRKNIKNNFVLKNDAGVPEKVFLVDDVITSGATVEEAAKVLKRAGAKEVVCLAVALA